ncbi:MAG TPA: type II toxin-antitoxin system VapC family toxin [Thermoanaerobaculia bacterium]|nr:type II toxin-antitoxin system VapC family toxin [Thermoanaerobaculia bacterium]
MKGIDTNILVRFVTRDDPRQAQIIRDLFEQAEAENERFHVSSTVLCELVWVLRSQYRYDRGEICSTLASLLEIGLLQVQDRDLARRALEQFRTGPADFSDYLIGWQDRRAGCQETLTFDRGLDETPGFLVLH